MKYTRLIWILGSAALSLLLYAGSLFAQSNVKNEFLAEYEPAEKKLQDVYSRLRMKVKSERRNGKDTVVEEFEFKANGPLFRVDWFRGVERSSVANPNLSFQVVKQKNGPYRLAGIDLGYMGLLEGTRTATRLPFAAYCIYDFSISKIIRLDAFHIDRAIRTGTGEAERIKLTYQAGAPNKRVSGWFVFAPQDCWALQEYAKGLTGKFPAEDTSMAVIEYDGKSPEGIPLVKKVRYWQAGSNKNPSECLTMERVELSLDPVPEEAFTLTAFGISHVGGPSSQRYYNIIIIGLVLLIAALGIRYGLRRWQRPA